MSSKALVKKENDRNRLAVIKQAAAYARMSTDNQKFSIQIQLDIIHEYAQRHKIEIVENFVDYGKSGLSLKGRASLTRLLDYVQSGQANFSIILVLDVSRWGRFQDTDESAHYEYLCRKAGIEVRYIAEAFCNELSPFSSIVKNIKRIMAAEYSRELSRKVSSGKIRAIKMGYHEGCYAPYGFRRVVVDEKENIKKILQHGEFRSKSEYKTVLAHGPDEEIQIIQWIYEMYTQREESISWIVRKLNAKGVSANRGTSWSINSVRYILSSEVYIGNKIWNRSSCKIPGQSTPNKKEEWQKVEGVWEPIISSKIFEKAQVRLKEGKTTEYSKAELLEKLQDLYLRYGYITKELITSVEDIPSPHTYAYRFGNMANAYRACGYIAGGENNRWGKENRIRKRKHADTVKSLINEVQKHTSSIKFDMKSECYVINRKTKMFIFVTYANTYASGKYFWREYANLLINPDMVAVIRMKPNKSGAYDFYFIPKWNPSLFKKCLPKTYDFSKDPHRTKNIEEVFGAKKKKRMKMKAKL